MESLILTTLMETPTISPYLAPQSARTLQHSAGETSPFQYNVLSLHLMATETQYSCHISLNVKRKVLFFTFHHLHEKCCHFANFRSTVMCSEYGIVRIEPFQCNLVILHLVSPGIQDGCRKITQNWGSQNGHQGSPSA